MPTPSPGQLRASIQQRLKNQSASSGQPLQQLRRKYVMTRFLTRVFDADPDGWVLKGGTGMMVRLPQARYSKDVDLMSTDFTDIGDAIDKLREILRHEVDAFTYTISRKEDLTDDKGTRISVQVRLGATVFDTFPIDLVTHRGLIGPVEIHPIPQVIDFGDPAEPVRVRVYPIADQIADKLCAMYEYHLRTGQPPPGDTSTRYRDLVDLLLISQNLPVPLRQAVEALENQRQLRNGMELPPELRPPGPDWHDNWSAQAKDSPVHDSLHELNAALTAAASCYNSILAGIPTTSRTATWDPIGQQWTDH
ncbi:nucleotidyl transferase AbiEii/AbiGii toxin family protein [Rhodococcus sp. WS4]|nr:nucleotidyl transferase AbiEii/AbiGii toxin family protein [Rhodococcus sp. WS4]